MSERLAHGHDHETELERLDRSFDRLIPSELRHLAALHWTPVRAAVRAASLLCAGPETRVLDIGSGVGKLCAIGALSSIGQWCGVEQHESLVAVARRLSRALGVAERTQFWHGDAFSVDWRAFDALYLYNPFELPLFGATRPAAMASQIERLQQRLAALPARTRVVTLNGFGGAMPRGYELLYHERMDGIGIDLTLWIRRRTDERAEDHAS